MRVPQFYVRSNVHMTNLDCAINRLLVNESLIDVTLVCDGHKFQCHRLVLAAASPLLEGLLMEHPKEHPIVIIPIGVKWHILKALIEFIYRGQTCVNQAELKILIESAELLQVIGLYHPQTQFREFYGDDENDVCLYGEDNALKENVAEFEQSEYDTCANREKDDNTEQNVKDVTTDETNDIEMTSNEKPVERIVDFIEIDDSQDSSTTPEHCNAFQEEQPIMNTNNGICDETTNIINITPAESNINIKKEKNTDETIVEDTKLIENDILQNVPIMSTEQTVPTIRVTPTIKLINLFKLNRQGQSDENQTPSKGPWTYIHIPAQQGSILQSPSTQVPLQNATSLPWSVDELPKLMPAVISKPIQDTDSASAAVPSFLKFYSSSMAISVQNLDRTKSSEKLSVLNMALDPEGDPESDITQADVQQDLDSEQELQTEGNCVKHEIELKTELMDFDSGSIYLNHNDFPNFYDVFKKERGNKSDEADAESEAELDAENIVCQPNVSYIYDDDDYAKDVEYVDDNEDGVCIDYDRLVAETYGNMQEVHETSENEKNELTKKLKKSILEHSAEENNTSLYSPETNCLQRIKDPPTLVPLSVMNAGLGPKHLYYDFSKTVSGFDSTTAADANLNDGNSHTKHSVILRNPRCNQPRLYSNESLYAALMAVKSGNSIYKASRMHQVPRKTLRNWMKRWDIKSQYPMPKQLKDAAKKKKLNQSQST